MSEFDPTPQPDLQGAPPQPASAAPVEPAAGPVPRKSRAGIFFLGAFSGCLVVLAGMFFLMIAAFSIGRGNSGELSIGQKVAVVPLEGEITDSREVIDAIHKYANNSMVKAIVIRINSPGGAIAPSQEIYSEIRRTREKSGKPFVASIDSVGASGGYYVAVACDEIVANPGSITGSIGVILQWFDVKDLLAWAKMKPETITSGSMKAAGSPYRDLSDAEREYLQSIVMQLHSQFVKAVAAARNGKISEQQVAALADGRVFTGEQALALKLIDRLGNLNDAVNVAGRLGGIKGEPVMLYPKRRTRSLMDLITDSNETRSFIESVAARRVPQFLYRW